MQRVTTWLVLVAALTACVPVGTGGSERPRASADGAVAPDADGSEPDAWAGPVDAAAPTSDAAPDASVEQLDAEPLPPDADRPAVDAEVPDADLPDADLPDADLPDPDAGLPDPDAGLPEPDAGLPDPDAGLPDPDAGLPGPDAAPACEPACVGRVCGPDGCGGTCGACPGGHCQAGQCAPPNQAPRILSLNASARRLTVGEAVRIDVIVTDPDGIADVIGGTLEDPAGASYGAFATSGEEGAYSATVRWADLHRVDPITFEGEAGQRTLRVRFFDQAGHSVTAPFVLTLHCNGLAVCDGVCRDLQTDADHCGGCGVVCPSLDVQAQCVDGACGQPCPHPGQQIICGDRCLFPTSEFHCGGCDVRCADGEDGFAACVDQQCEVAQPDTLVRYDGPIHVDGLELPSLREYAIRFDLDAPARIALLLRRAEGDWARCDVRSPGWRLYQRGDDGDWISRLDGCDDDPLDGYELSAGQWMFRLEHRGQRDALFEFLLFRLEPLGPGAPEPHPEGGWRTPALSESADHALEGSPYGVVVVPTVLACFASQHPVTFTLTSASDLGGASVACDTLGQGEPGEVRGPGPYTVGVSSRDPLAHYTFEAVPAVAEADLLPFGTRWGRWDPDPVALGDGQPYRVGEHLRGGRDLERPWRLHLPVPAEVTLTPQLTDGRVMDLRLVRLEGAYGRTVFDEEIRGQAARPITRQLEPGDYVITAAVDWDGDGVAFDLTFQVDADRAPEARVSFFEPPPLVAGRPLDAPALDEDERHHYAFEIERDATVTLAVDDGARGCPGDSLMRVYNALGESVAFDNRDGPGDCPLIETDLPGGRYVVQVYHEWGWPLPPYQLRLAVDP